jgi:methionyl aminopeptidase
MAEAQRVCEGCGAEAKLRCPTCIKMKLPDSFFCGQVCFKANWGMHKLKHVEPVVDDYRYTGTLRPGLVSPMRSVPDSIEKPDYAVSGIPVSEQKIKNDREIPIYTAEEIEHIRYSCRISRECLDLAHSLIRPGVTTEEIDIAVHEFCIEHDAYPSPLNYYKFPKSVCTSVNEVVCHGIPDSRPLENGDIVNVDVSIYYKGYHGDLNETFLVGDVDDRSKLLVRTAYESMMKAIEACKPGMKYREIGNIITRHVEKQGFSVDKTYCGHGVGKDFHCPPMVPHYANNSAPGVMRAGHVFTIEPMINMGTFRDQVWRDGWTAVTQDGQRSAQFENTIMITETGYEILTARLPTSPQLECLL